MNINFSVTVCTILKRRHDLFPHYSSAPLNITRSLSLRSEGGGGENSRCHEANLL